MLTDRALILEARDYLKAQSFPLPPELKRRDGREPGRRQKEEYEDKVYSLVWRQFRKQKRMVASRIQAYFPFRKASIPAIGLTEADFEDPEFVARLQRLLTEASIHGINLFEADNPIGIDYTLVNGEAIDWARDYSYDLVKGINQTTVEQLQRTISGFVETPGMTIRDVVDSLPFSEGRAFRVATTEITRAYAEANDIAGHRMQQEFPDVKVVKIWFTNNDDRVCPICGPLDGKEVDLKKQFAKGIDKPPAHVNCRCWTTTTTKLPKGITPGASLESGTGNGWNIASSSGRLYKQRGSRYSGISKQGDKYILKEGVRGRGGRVMAGTQTTFSTLQAAQNAGERWLSGG